MNALFHGRRGLVLALCVGIMVLSRASDPAAQTTSPTGPAPVTPNFDLGSRWTSAKVGKLVFDTSVTPHWLQAGGRFWYSYQTRDGRRFTLVDPVKKTKAPLFDHAKMAATLTSITRQPYDAQHLPFSTIKFKNDTVFEFDVSVPRDADIVTTKKKVTTSQDEPDASAFRRSDGEDDDPQQQGQRGAGPGAAGRTPPRNRTLRFEYDLAAQKLTLNEDYVAPTARPRWASVSPDEQTIVFARNHNLYAMDAASFAKAQKNANDTSIVETKLTTDGEEYYSYARSRQQDQQIQEQQQQQQQQQQQDQQDQQDQTQQDTTTTDKNARVPAVNVIWSQDSKRFALIRRDERKVKDLWVINALSNPRPTLETYRYAMPGEENIAQPEMYVFDLAAKKQVRVKNGRFKDETLSIATAPITEREREEARTLGGGQGQGGQGGGGQGGPGAGANIPAKWLSASPDKIYFTRLSRDMKRLDVCVADAATGDVKPIIEERSNTYIESRPLRLVNNGQDLLFWSERDGWGHYYLYDAGTGALKNRISEGEFVSMSVEGWDDKAKTLFITAVGREKGEDPYFPHLYRVGYDGSSLKLLNAGNASHAVSMADDTRYFIDNASRVDMAPESVLVDGLGNVVTKLETPDLSALKEAGFKFAEPFSVKADDGVTDLYGVMYKPFDFDQNKKYPIIAYVYPGPQTESVTKTFNPRGTSMSLAQYGFIVIEVGNRGGNPQRSKWYHNYGYGNLRDYGLADKKTAIEQLAARCPYIDINRVGIWGHSGGGFMSAAAMLVYPDFFKVAWSESGNHENNIYNNTWSEKNHGIKEVEKDGKVTFEFSIEKNSELAKNLKGHLMLVTGDIDNNVHPANTYRLADALIKANKRFDFLIIPGKRHGYADAGPYINQRRAEYFCRYLLGKTQEDADMVELNREQQQNGRR
jgi:dipeptidyl aminopeptidase/acylaminoacyl peptidase